MVILISVFISVILSLVLIKLFFSDNYTLLVKIVNKSKHKLPKYETNGSVGMDLRSNIDDDIILKSGERKMIPTGIYIQLPDGYEAQVRPRSGLSIKQGLTVINTPGTIDSDYTGEICVLMINHSDVDVKISDGDRIAQMVINKVEKIEWFVVDELDKTERGTGGFGHTGKK